MLLHCGTQSRKVGKYVTHCSLIALSLLDSLIIKAHSLLKLTQVPIEHHTCVCLCLCLLSYPIFNKQGGFKHRNCVFFLKKFERGGRKKELRRVIFLPSIPRSICSGGFHSSCHISFPAVHICVCVSVHLYVACMCELCEGLVLRWWFIATGSGPICFRSVSCSVLASLQHSPSWPDMESGWDPFKSAWNEHGIHMRTHTHKPLSLTLLSPSAFFSLNSTNSRKHPCTNIPRVK